MFEWLLRTKTSPDQLKGALDDIEKSRNLVWLYLTDDQESIVGFGALGPVEWRWPDADGEEVAHLQIVYAGIDRRFRGSRDADGSYARQIMEHLIDEARDRSEATFVSLFVHEQNTHASDFYQRLGFEFEDRLNDPDQLTGAMYRAMYRFIR